jgi:GNAT superfamily N-acetyltransferase
LVDLVLTSFADESAMNYFFGDRYDELAPAFFRYLTDLWLDSGEVWAATEDEAPVSVAMFNAPGGSTLPAAELNARWDCVAEVMPEAVRWRLDDYQARLRDLKPASRHYYLSVLATDPQRQGQGLSRLVLGPAFRRADERGWDTYLETASATSVAIYERFGFVVSDEVDLPQGPRVRWMRRPTSRT